MAADGEGLEGISSVSTFAVRLRELRTRHNLTLAQLAERSRIHVSQLGRYERGLQPSIASIVQLAQALDIEPSELAAPVLSDAAANSPVANKLYA